jgi:WD40 repeat protein
VRNRGGFVLIGVLLGATWVPVLSEAAANEEPRLESKIAVKDEVVSTAFSRDGKIAAVLKNNKIGIWSAANGQPIQMLEFGAEQPLFADFLNNGEQLLAGLHNGVIQLREVQTGKVLRTLENGAPARIVRVSRDGKLLAATGANHEIALWDFANGKLLRRTEPNLGDLQDLAFSPDGTLLASSAEDTDIYLWDTKTGQKKAVVSDLPLTTFALAFAPDGKWLFTGSGDGAIHVIDTGSGKLARSFAAQKYAVFWLWMSPDGRRLATVHQDGNDPKGNTPIVLWSAESGQVLQRFDAAKMMSNGSGFASDGRLFYSTSNGKELQVWSLR